VFTKNKRTRASSKNPSSVPSLTPAMQELRNGWKRGQPLPAALRVHALELVDSGVSPESIRLWRTPSMKENRNAEAQRTPRGRENQKTKEGRPRRTEGGGGCHLVVGCLSRVSYSTPVSWL